MEMTKEMVAFNKIVKALQDYQQGKTVKQKQINDTLKGISVVKNGIIELKLLRNEIYYDEK